MKRAWDSAAGVAVLCVCVCVCVCVCACVCLVIRTQDATFNLITHDPFAVKAVDAHQRIALPHLPALSVCMYVCINVCMVCIYMYIAS